MHEIKNVNGDNLPIVQSKLDDYIQLNQRHLNYFLTIPHISSHERFPQDIPGHRQQDENSLHP